MHYFIDGYNLLFRMLGDPNPLEKNRREVIESLNEKISNLKLNVTIVFDGSGLNEPESTRHHFDRLEIVYTSKTLSADDYILEEILCSLQPTQETVVTSDKGLASRCKNAGAKIQTVEDFLAWIEKKQKKNNARKSNPVQKSLKDSDVNFFRLLKIFESRLSEDLKKLKDEE
jgi:predicted RNA-binding protein with PIN domain